MADVATHIAKEAKGLQQDLKELLKKNDLFDKEIDIKRKNLRRQYLRLLFLHPYARESKDAETHLWMQTSYSLISIYKQRIATLDRAIHNPPRASQQQQQQQQHSSNSHRTVEYRKLLQRFRQFLAEEEKFWMQLVLRFRRYFALDEAQPMLNVLGILPEDDQTPAAEGATSVTSPRRNQHQFPPECDAVGSSAPVPTSSGQRESRTAILSKALVCLGDIARYKEQYNESGGRPRAGHEDGPPAVSSARGGRGRRGGAGGQTHVPLPRLRNYDRAQACYEQARLLLPHDGNPSHQLGILSSYQKDTLSSIAHYYRALCVRTPYETASENLGSALHRALETYKSRGLVKETEKEEEIATSGFPTPRVRVEAFKEKVVILHALWYTNDDEASSMGDRVLHEFSGLVADRILPIEMISKVVVLVQGALWKFRMIRRPSHGERRSSRPSSTESNIVTHLIATHRVLLENGSVELAEAPPDDAALDDLAQRITATFRRTLPALRMAGKWLRSNTRYLSQGLKAPTSEEQPTLTKDASKGKDRRHGSIPVTIGGIVEFWREYARFSDTLARAFPDNELPPLRTQLEEDIEMAGFLPLRKYMVGSDGNQIGSSRQPAPSGRTNADSSRSQDGSQSSRDQVHPNEEQLMRISDILADAEAITEDEYTPIQIDSGHFVVTDLIPVALRGESQNSGSEGARPNTEESVSQHQVVPSYQAAQRVEPFLNGHGSAYRPADADEDSVSITTDDPVDDAFKKALDGSVEEDEDDQIIWQPHSPLSPREDPIVKTLPKTPDRPSPIGTGVHGLTPRRGGPLSPPFKQSEIERSPPMVAQNGTPLTTARDLLQDVLGIHRSPPASHHTRSSSGLLFGSGASNSIWSTAGETQSLPYSTNGLGNGSQYPSPPAPPPLPPSQTMWSSSSPWQSPPSSQHVQLNYTNSVPSRSYAPQQAAVINSSHYRAPSESIMFSRPQGLAPAPPPTIQHFDAINGGGNPGMRYGGLNMHSTDLLPPTGLPEPFLPSSTSSYYRQDVDSRQVHPPANHVPLDRTFKAPYAPPSVSNIWGNTG